jgi:hypothetical protein
MKVSELIKELKKHDPNIEVGGVGHFGELLEIYDVRICTDDKGFIGLDIEYAGECPD